MTVGTLKALVERCAEHLQPIEKQIATALQQGEVMNQDETSLLVGSQRFWMHVGCTACLTHYAVYANRGRKALDAIGLLKGFTGMSVHDGLASYQSYPCLHALCNVHHLRELTFVEEGMGQPWAVQMKTLLLVMKAAVQTARAAGESRLLPDALQQWRTRYQSVLLTARKHLPAEADTRPPKRGRKP